MRLFSRQSKKHRSKSRRTPVTWVRVRGRYGIGAHQGLHGVDGAGEF